MDKVQIVHLELVRDGELFYEKSVNEIENILEIAQKTFQQPDREKVYVCGVDSSHVPVYLEMVALGHGNSCSLEVKDVFKSLIVSNCKAFFMWHFHVGQGKLKTSTGDIRVTEKMEWLGNFMGIPLLDHLIIGRKGYVSIMDELRLE